MGDDRQPAVLEPVPSYYRWLPRSLNGQLFLFTALSLIITIFGFATYSTAKQSELARSASNKLISELAKNLADLSVGHILVGDLDNIENLLLNASSFPWISSIAIADTDGKLLSEVVNQNGKIALRYNQERIDLPIGGKYTEEMLSSWGFIFGKNKTLIAWERITGGNLLGWVKITYNTEDARQTILKAWQDAFLISGLSITSALLLLTFLIRPGIKSLNDARQFAEKLDRNLGDHISVSSTSIEIQSLDIALNAVSSRLKLQDESLKKNFEYTRHILDNVIDGVVTVNELGLIETMNKSAERIFDFPLDEVIGRNFKMLLTEPYQDIFDGYIDDYLTVGTTAHIIRSSGEIDGCRKVGGAFPIELTVSCSAYQGQPLFIGIVRDISERKRKDEELELFNLMIEKTGDAIFMIDDDDGCRMKYVNEATVNHFGVPREEILTWRIPDWNPNFTYDSLDKHVEEIKKFKNLTIESTHRIKDGMVVPVEISLNYIHYKGKTCHFGFIKNITERKHLDEIKNEFISTVSHELRTPLTSIRGSLALIAGGVAGELPTAVKPLVDIAHKNSQRLILLVNDILDMEKIATGKMEFNIQPADLMALLPQSLEANRAYAEQFDVTYVLENELLGDMMVSVDTNRLLQVLANLLSNAAKFSFPGGTVKVGVERNGDRIRVSVKDNGPGIPDAFKERIFQKFSQADASDTRKKGGTGLGLSITKALVEQMGGTIDFYSEPNVLTMFYVDFPEWKKGSL